MPDEQDDERADNGADQARALIGPVPPTAWPMKVARKAPAMPSSVVRMKPAGLFGPGASRPAIMPATKPLMITQSNVHSEPRENSQAYEFGG